MFGFKRLILIILALLLTVGVARAQQQQGPEAPGDEFANPSVLIPVNLSGTFNRFNIAIPAFQSLKSGGKVDQNAQTLPARLGKNLDMTGFFQILDPRASLEADPMGGLIESSPFNYAPWAQIGASFVVKGGLTISGSKLTMELRLFDVSVGEQRLAKRYNGPLKEAKRMIARFTNDILLAVTGEAGVFGSKIIFVMGEKVNKSISMTELGLDEAEGIFSSKKGPATQPTLGPGNKAAWAYRNGRKWELMSGGSVVHSGETVFSPAFMPNGSLVAGLSGRVSTHLYVFSGRSAKQLTNGASIELSPTFSPDGSRMAYVSNQGGAPGVYVTSSSGGVGARISPGGTSTDPSWSPKGDKIVFVHRQRDICVVNPDGSGLVQLTGGQGRNLDPSFSPDGRMIVFSSDRGGRTQLYIMSANGDRQQPLIPEVSGSQSQPSWSPDKPEQ
ncbi:MAG: hypothetical protein LBV23_07960 [Deltaproteobacteria bacterium]|jgi:TolB protein|nr:hypothetical protein [Deltaproteobacteria bacterium]